mmetsp:Transcript_14476/g.50372  ORF Transcript_14476/g.50372 Transcript_14476/m.50372 type:complete len:88 (-) Transcript_14476:1954-2217(-)
MNTTRPVLGGDRRFHYPKYVWTPAGGWWHRPAAWKANTRVAAVVLLGVGLFVGSVSAAKERRPIPPRSRAPTQFYAKHAAVDDPSMR